MNRQNGKFSISTDKSRLDIDFIQRSLAGTYWAEDIPGSIVEKSIENSLCFGVFEGDKQIGIARPGIYTKMKTRQ